MSFDVSTQLAYHTTLSLRSLCQVLEVKRSTLLMGVQRQTMPSASVADALHRLESSLAYATEPPLATLEAAYLPAQDEEATRAWEKKVRDLEYVRVHHLHALQYLEARYHRQLKTLAFIDFLTQHLPDHLQENTLVLDELSVVMRKNARMATKLQQQLKHHRYQLHTIQAQLAYLSTPG